MEELAQVVENKGDKVLIKVERHSSCSSCEKDCALSGYSHESDEIEFEIENVLKADVGDIVRIEMQEKPLVVASLLVYIFPLVGLIGGYFFTNYILRLIGFTAGEISGIIGGLFFLALSFTALKTIDKKIKTIESFHPKMTEIVS
ncbi:MAG: SoxR reducing system RseC family protein [Halanaerobiales bacterium]